MTLLMQLNISYAYLFVPMYPIYISSVLNIPVIEPTNWDDWWTIWNKHAKTVAKVRGNHNSSKGRWIGFDCYRASNYNVIDTPYDSEYVDCRNVLPDLYKFVETCGLDIQLVRILESKSPFNPHKDHSTESYSIRTMLYDNNPSPTFYYFINGRKHFQTLPKESNTWMYKDHLAMHGSNFNPKYKKILITYAGNWTLEESERLFTNHEFVDHKVIYEQL